MNQRRPMAEDSVLVAGLAGGVGLLGNMCGALASELCSHITQRQFQDLEDHSSFVGQGGCQEVIEFVSDWVAGQ